MSNNLLPGSDEPFIFFSFSIADIFQSHEYLVWNYLDMTCFELFYGLARALWTAGGPVPGRAAWHWTEWSQQVPQRPGWVLACYSSVFAYHPCELWQNPFNATALYTTLKPHPHTVSTFQFRRWLLLSNYSRALSDPWTPTKPLSAAFNDN